MSDRRNVLWRSSVGPDALAVTSTAVVISNANAILALDRTTGATRWRRDLPRKPDRLVRCGDGVAFDLSDRSGPPQVLALADADGDERWRYERRWSLLFGGLVGDEHDVVMYGQDDGTSENRWVALDAGDGQVRFDISPPADDGPELAPDWLVASIEGGERGIVRARRDGTEAATVTALRHDVLALADQSLLLNTSIEGAPNEVVAIEIATGRECWRAPSGPSNGTIAVDGKRAAWVDAKQCPVVHELSSGKQVWSGDPLPDILASNSYTCRLGGTALVTYCGHRHVAYHTLDASAPFLVRAWNREASRASRFDGAHFLEGSADGLICWQLETSHDLD